VANLVVLDGEENEALVVGLEDGLVGVAGDGRVTDEAVASIVLKLIDLVCRLVLLAALILGCRGDDELLGCVQLVGEGGNGLGEVELVEGSGGNLGGGFENGSGDHGEARRGGGGAKECGREAEREGEVKRRKERGRREEVK
jgi:hypothetical protein